MKSGLYLITNTANKKIYVGSAYNVVDRIKCHIREANKQTHHNKYLQEDWNKYGCDVFQFEIIELATKQQLASKEDFYIHNYESHKRDIGYNILNTAHSFHGLKHTEETKKKMSESALERWHGIDGEEHRRKISEAMAYQWASGQKKNPAHRGPMSQEQKLKISLSKRGTKHRLKDIEKRIETKLKNHIYKVSDEQILRIRNRFENLDKSLEPTSMARIRQIAQLENLTVACVKQIVYKTCSYKNR